MFVSKLHENIFQARRQRPNLCHGDAFLQKLLAQVVQIEVVVNQRVDGLAENRRAADSGKSAGRIAAPASPLAS